MIPYRQSQFQMDEEIVAIHLNGVFVACLDISPMRMNLCHWQGYFVEIYCRQEQQVWRPYQIKYHRESADYINTLKDRLDHAQVQQLWQVLKKQSIARLN